MINLGLIGSGYWGSKYIQTLEKVKDSKLITICDLKRPNINLEDKKFTPDYKEILKDSSIDGIIIATPPETHYQLTREALEHKKNVLVEKPFTQNSQEALELLNLADKKNLTLMVGHVFLYNPALIELRDILEKEKLGKVNYVLSRRIKSGATRNPINSLWNLAPHDISMMNYLADKMPEEIYSINEKSKNEDLWRIHLQYPKFNAEIQVDNFGKARERILSIWGDKNLIFNDDTGNKLMMRRFDKKDEIIPFVQKNPLEEECSNFVKSIAGYEKPVADALNGFQIVKLIELAELSNKKGKIISLNPKDFY